MRRLKTCSLSCFPLLASGWNGRIGVGGFWDLCTEYQTCLGYNEIPFVLRERQEFGRGNSLA